MTGFLHGYCCLLGCAAIMRTIRRLDDRGHGCCLATCRQVAAPYDLAGSEIERTLMIIGPCALEHNAIAGHNIATRMTRACGWQPGAMCL